MTVCFANKLLRRGARRKNNYVHPTDEDLSLGTPMLRVLGGARGHLRWDRRRLPANEVYGLPGPKIRTWDTQIIVVI